jgi:hypothetical protein
LENIYHRFLNLPFEIERPEITYTIPDKLRHETLSIPFDEMNRWLRSLNLMCLQREVFYTPPGGGAMPIHLDKPLMDNRVKINLTWGPEEGRTRWWKLKDGIGLDDVATPTDLNVYKSTGFSDDKHDNLLFTEETCEMVYEASTNRPSLLNIGQLHSTYNPGTEGRWTVCYQIGWRIPRMHDGNDNSLKFNDALKVFGPIIEES